MKNWQYVFLIILIAFVFVIPLLSSLQSLNNASDWKSLKLTVPSLSRINNFGGGDWDFVCFQNEVARQTILEYHQFPLWNAFASGGRPLIANHQNGFLRPLFLLTLAFGCVVASKLEIFITVAFGMVGMFLLSMHYRMHPLAGVLSACIFGLTSFFSLHITEGHFIFLSFYMLPYVFLFYLKSFERLWWAILSAACVALIILGGGSAYVMIPLIVFLGTYALISAIKKTNVSPLTNLAFIFLLAFGFAAVKLIPTIVYTMSHPILKVSNELTRPLGLYHIFFGTEQGLDMNRFVGQVWGWHEYGAYVGWLPALFFVVGLVFFFKSEIALIGAGIFTFIVSIGDFGNWTPWHVLHQLPFVQSTHVPSRFVIMFVFALAIIAGLMLNLILKKQDHLKYICVIVVLLAVLELLVVDSKTFAQAFPNRPIEFEDRTDFKQINDYNVGRSGADSSMYMNLIGHNGTLDAYDPVFHPTYARGLNDENYKGEVYLELEGNTSYEYWSPNKLIVNVETQELNRVIINQNYDKGWRVKGGQAESFNGLLSTNVSESDKKVEFYYLPRSFIIGAIISLVSTSVCVIFYIRDGFKMKT